MGQIAELIVTAGRRPQKHAENLLRDIRPEQFARKPNVNGRIIDTNHAAFNFGHLALYPARIVQLVGQDLDAVAVPAAWPGLFQAGTACSDDVAGNVYPPMAEISAAFFRGYEGALAAVARADEGIFARPTPEERYRTMFPTIGAAVLMLLNNHVMGHLGQVSTWRRCMGLGPAV